MKTRIESGRSLCSLPETIGDDDDGPIILSKIVLTLLYK